MKTKNAFYNTITGFIFYLVTIIANLISRKALISILGIEYQGVNGLFSNILSMLAIAELGIGGAILYHLYEPLVKDDKPLIIQLMQFYKRCYYWIAGLVAAIGLLIMPFLRFTVSDYDLPLSLTGIYIWYLLDVVCSYFFSYKRSLLIADQKNFIVNICDTVYQLEARMLQIVFLLVTQSFYGFLVAMVIARLIENISISYITDKRYPYIRSGRKETLPGTVLEDIKLKVKGAIFHNVGTFAINGTDNILISMIFGLRDVGIYSNYQLIITALSNAASQIKNAVTAGIGHMLVSDDLGHTREIFNEVQLLNAFVTILISVGLYCVADKVIIFVFGGEYVIDHFTLLVLSINMFMTGMRRTYASFKEAAGILYEDRFIPLIESTINIVASIICAKIFGLAGIFIGTILSSLVLFLYTYPVLIYKGVLKLQIKNYYLQLLHIFAVFALDMIVCGIFTEHIYRQIDNLILSIIAGTFLTALLSLMIFGCFYCLKRPETLRLIKKIKIMLK